MVVSEEDSTPGIITRFFNWLKNPSFTGHVVKEDELVITQDEENIVVDLEGFVEVGYGVEEDVVLEYYTDAPVSEETKTKTGKKVKISGPDEIHYENILAYTTDNNVNLFKIM